MEYKIIEAKTIEELEKIINKSLQDGWSLYGNIIVEQILVAANSRNKLYQAMTKEAPKKKSKIHSF